MNDPLLDFASIENLLASAAPAPPMPGIGVGYPDTPTPGMTPLPYQHLGPVRAPNPIVPVPDYANQPAPGKPLAPSDLGLFAQLIRKTESGHNYQAKNPNTSASGAYQYVNKTWGNYGGYPEARLAPRHVQDAKFAEDAIQKLHRYNGDPFKMIADHMLPAQANKPWLWSHPSTIMVHGRPQHIPPVAEYIRKVIRNSPWESQFEQYLKSQAGAQ